MSDKPKSYQLSPLARSDLDSIWLYSFNTWSQKQADDYLGYIFDAFHDISNGSKYGHKVDIREGYFKYPVGSHFIFYRDYHSHIDVIRVLHQRMDVMRHITS